MNFKDLFQGAFPQQLADCLAADAERQWRMWQTLQLGVLRANKEMLGAALEVVNRELHELEKERAGGSKTGGDSSPRPSPER